MSWQNCSPFCKAHTEVYIYGTDYPQQMLWKLSKSSPSLSMKGLVDAEQRAPVNGVSVAGISDVISRPGAGVILGLPDWNYRYVILACNGGVVSGGKASEHRRE